MRILQIASEDREDESENMRNNILSPKCSFSGDKMDFIFVELRIKTK
jgi:hypothetical protein